MEEISRKAIIRYMAGIVLTPFVPGLLPPELPAGSHSHVNNHSGLFPIPDDEKIKLQPFAFNAVKVNSGSLYRQLEYIKNYYLEIPNDDLLKGFRERVGISTYGARDLGGWYTTDTFHIFGQLLSGYSRLFAATGDVNCKNKMIALIEGWAECIGKDGYFYYTKHPNAPHYIFDKMVGGLVDAVAFTGYQKALTYLSVVTDWAIQNLDKDRPYANGSDKGAYLNAEWYTLSENLYRAYQLTGDQKYFDFAQYWEYKDYWKLLAEKKNIFFNGFSYHAYSHLNTLSGAAMAYILKEDRFYLDTIMNGYDYFQNEQCFATGGYGPAERLLNKKEIMASLDTRHDSFETQCGSWAAFKLCKYLITLTGDGRYGDWVEKLIYNGVGADIPISPDGRILYYSDYNTHGGSKKNHYRSWTCCTGTRPQDVAEYGQLIYFHNQDGIFVNLYTPSEVEWKGIRLIQETMFPEKDYTVFKIQNAGSLPKSFPLHFRNPGWLPGKPEMAINGKIVRPDIENNWLKYERQWKAGDEIKLSFPMELRISRLDKEKKYPAAIVFGPVVLAVRSGDGYPGGLLEKENLFVDFEPVAGEPLTWHVKHSPDLLVRPYYAFKENEPYVLYIDSDKK